MKAVVIAFDRLSSWSLGCYGNPEVRTPQFDRLAAESVVFDQHFGENFDPAARNHAWWTGCHQFLRTPEQQSDCPHTAEVLRAAGVETWLIRDASETSLVPEPTGFDHVLDFDAASDDDVFRARCRDAINEWASNPQAAGLLWLQDPGLPSPEQRRPDAIVVAGTESDESLASSPAGDDSALMLDRRLGIVLDLLDDTMAQNLLTIVTAASGSLLGDRSNFLSGERPLAEEQVHTPLLIHDANATDGGSRRQSLVQTIDLPPTLLDWFEAADRLPRCDGESLFPLLRGEATDIHNCLFLGDGQGNAAIRTPDWYLIGRTVRSDESERVELTGPGRLFIKPDDVWDIQDVAAQAPREAARLRERLEEFLTRNR